MWHPEVNIYFPYNKHILAHVDMDAHKVDISGLICGNYWTALCFAPRSLFNKVPYPETTFEHQIGYEDWGWNTAVLAHGAIHKTVPLTGHLIRVKQRMSVVAKTNAARCIPMPSSYFPQVLCQRQGSQANFPGLENVTTDEQPVSQLPLRRTSTFTMISYRSGRSKSELMDLR